MSDDKQLDDIKRQIFKRIIGKTSKPSFLQSNTVNILTDANFDQAVKEASQLLLVDFWAEWCSPCRMMAPMVEALAREYSKHVYFAKLNVDQNQLTAMRFRVMSIPNFVLFQNGLQVDQVLGAVGRQGLESLIKRHLSKV
jgi:thioredoxin 1